ncbi:hypothetical protein NUU61_008558 [Penicillium alfredii]|uniref:Uncharacterized protein n=1 Tax=Penicillium alfredii TaxID=1506179 RepID=A0A9W9ELN1_9EURO|nr:uncharacterized protein NUU61_008558 [Penicillium alfredii]KAJ5083979.1 hypothetical protein NUU61_008558 [Penicillium alfredii]
MLQFIIYLFLQLALFAAWISGALDPYQKQLQEVILDYMGETKVSYGLKKSLTGKRLTEEETLRKIQDQLGNQLGGIFGKGGLGEGLGSVLSKGL